MKRKDIMKKLKAAGCAFVEGGNHTVVFSADGRRLSSVPRHAEINEHTTDAIARQTGVKLRG